MNYEYYKPKTIEEEYELRAAFGDQWDKVVDLTPYCIAAKERMDREAKEKETE